MSASWHDQVIYALTGGSSHPFSQVSSSPLFLWGTLKIDFCSTTNHKTSTYTKVNVDPYTMLGQMVGWVTEYK